MKVSVDTLRGQYIPVRPVIFEKKEQTIIMLKDDSKHIIGQVLLGDDEGKYVMFPKYSGFEIDGFNEVTRLVPKHDIICFVEPDDTEKIVKYYDYKNKYDADNEWVNVIPQNSSKGGF